MLYLFCNRSYGEPFLRTAREWSRRHGHAITVILSDRRAAPHDPPRTGGGRLRRRLGSLRRRWKLGRELGLPVRVEADVNAKPLARRFDGTVGIVAGFDQIFKRRTIERFAALVNFHPSLLPYYRGPVPAYWCLRNGETATGFSLHRVVPAIDAGEVLWQQAVPIEAGDSAERLTQRIAAAAQPTFERYLSAVASGNPLEPRKLDAAAVYRVREEYNSFPSD